MDEMLPCKFAEYNSYLKTFRCTYYFSHATGNRKKHREKARELFNEPGKLTRSALGFDAAVSQNLKYRNSTKKLQRRDPHESITFWENAVTIGKVITNFLNIFQYTHYDNFWGLRMGLHQRDNRCNDEMNNLMSIDHTVRDWVDDTDYMLPRMGQEFPRLASNYSSKR